ncbi:MULTISPECIES: RhuM family protein [unclassified Microbacterium]|uniref:RhuM family protein n=1 Tax=unclassified Microbacterium TaxID=2609290 RepID=UPI00214B82AB|nr:MULTISPECIES: RhuM family protein [unclassified Microbacterium]MCR2809260.1 virulence RhuM family protein [Microbacterium sp. zg.B185]WIM20403.1 RhuM family protein [Microbacterium sp. zg-B185]
MTSAIEIFEFTDGVVSLELRSEGETVWASQADIEELFGIDQSGVSRHIRNILRTEEVAAESNMQKVHIAGSDRLVTLYSLDVVLAVGYRANSARAIEFRPWATDVLKRYLLKGVATNERRLRELDSFVQVLSRSSDQLVAGVAEVVARYLPSLRTLRDYVAQVIPLVDRPDPVRPGDLLQRGPQRGPFRGREILSGLLDDLEAFAVAATR